jgi:phytoene dehydrogenase-like protein
MVASGSCRQVEQVACRAASGCWAEVARPRLAPELLRRPDAASDRYDIAALRPPQRARGLVSDADVIIIGAGIAGLSAATALCDRGLRVTVIERSALLGGRACSWADEVTGDPVDLGPHIVTSQYPNMLAWLDRLGTRDQVIWSPDRAISLVGDGRTVKMRMRHLPAPLPFLPSILQSWMRRDAAVSAADILSNARISMQALALDETRVAELDDRLGRDYLLEQGVTERFIEWFWGPVSMTVLNLPIGECSAGALLRFYQQMIGHNVYNVGFPAAGLGDLFAPAAALAVRAAGGRLLTQCEAQGLVVENGAVRGVTLADGHRLEARACIAALPADALGALLPPQWRGRYPVFAAVDVLEPCPYVSVYLWLDRKLTDEHIWTRLYSPPGLTSDFYDLSNIRPALAGGNSLIASNIIYCHRAEGLDDEQIIAVTREELAEFAPEARSASIRHARVHRVPMSIHCPRPGTEKLRPSNATPVPGLWLAGDWTDTALPSSMESATRSGALAAEQVLATFGQRCEIALPPPALEGLAAAVPKLLGRFSGR